MPTWDEMCAAADEVRVLYDDINQRKLGRTWNLSDFVLGFTGDVGDLAKLILAHQGHRADVAADTGKIAHELSDCLFSLMVIAQETGIDLGDRFTADMAALAAHLRPTTAVDTQPVLEGRTGTASRHGHGPATVFTPPGAADERQRMQRAHAAAARTLRVEPTGPEVWGWQGRTLSRRAGRWWLRLVCASQERGGGRLWEGTATAQAALPPAVPRPRLHGLVDWSTGRHAYRAELSEYVPLPALQAGSPVLTSDPHLPDAWWTELQAALTATATVPTARQSVRQQWIDKHFTRLTGLAPIQITAWTTGHADLHWANLTGPPLVILDWETWGQVPVGYDAGLLHAYSLTRPATAARIRREFGHVLDTPAGRTGELVAIAQLLQVTARGQHPELAPLLARHAEHLTGRPIPVTTP
ncbi:hypothetical protein ACF9IK_29980 [Kitasatospora hibisci]|uniref:hypothetical protein n=1 Tax=Kitasatospora hibisci TaxID=3369522 RepID=UPI0037547CF2